VEFENEAITDHYIDPYKESLMAFFGEYSGIGL
jgi:hypothetical protein